MSSSIQSSLSTTGTSCALVAGSVEDVGLVVDGSEGGCDGGGSGGGPQSG